LPRFEGVAHLTNSECRFEEWTIAPDGLIAESRGHYDQAEYGRQVQLGIGSAI
jgi:hypothetical protein